jgi:hypothetical protein
VNISRHSIFAILAELMFPFAATFSAFVIGIVVALPARVAASSLTAAQGTMIAQDDTSSDEDNIPSDQVDKYIAVYTAMQKNHSLSVEQAASKQGLTVDQFRTLEDKIERNPVVHERVLDALKASASGKKAASGPSSKQNAN